MRELMLMLVRPLLLVIISSACASRVLAAGAGDCFVCAMWAVDRFVDHKPKRREESQPAPPVEPVRATSKLPRARYVIGTSAPVSGDASFRLEDGSVWSVVERLPALGGEVVIVMRDAANGTAYFATGPLAVQLKSGTAVARTGASASVVEATMHGRTLRLRLHDGSLWDVDDADRGEARTWSAPYPVLIQSDDRRFWNLTTGKRFRAKPGS